MGKPMTKSKIVAALATRFVCIADESKLVAALGRSESALGPLPAMPGWRRETPDPAVAAWTDDYSDIVGAILRKKLAR